MSSMFTFCSTSGARKLAVLVFLWPAAADAQRCPYGQILRVHLGKCVSWSSPLARSYVSFHYYPIKRDLVYRLPPEREEDEDFLLPDMEEFVPAPEMEAGEGRARALLRALMRED